VSPSIDFRIFDSRFEKSKASSTAVARAAVSMGLEESVFAWTRLALPDFLLWVREEEKGRTRCIGDCNCRGTAGWICLWLWVY
jgi:hypothetical protein